MRLQFAARSVTGRRSTNQDAWLARPESGLFAVSDGMGGLASGEEASNRTIGWLDSARLALDPLRELLLMRPDPPANLALLDALDSTFQQATSDIHGLGLDRGETMGATLTAGVVVGENLFIAHVGDTRVYLRRNQTLRQLTLDHSVAAERVRRGKMTLAEFEVSPYKNMLYQAVGITPEVSPDLLEVPLQDGDTLVFCCDGVWGSIDDEAFLRITGNDHLDCVAEDLLQYAYENGSSDNLTALVVRCRAEQKAGVDWNSVLQCTPLFSHLDAAARDRLAPFLQEIRCRPGDTVIREGDPGDDLFLVLEGEFSVLRAGVELRGLGQGDHFGEIALILDLPRQATVQALSAARLLVLRRRDLEELIVRRPEIGALILSRLLAHVAEDLVAVSGRLVAAEAALAALHPPAAENGA